MKKMSSVVWKFFDRIEENSRCVAVMCKLCECQYKFFGNTTNLRVHLINKHPIQWELSENGALDETNIRLEDTVDGNSSTPIKRRKRKANKNVRVSFHNADEAKGTLPQIEIQRVEVDPDGSDFDDDDATTLNLVRQMHGEQSAEEWLEEDPYQITQIETFEPRPKKRKFRKIKREVTSPTGLPGFYVAPKQEKIVYENEIRKDEYSVFGDYVANKLRKIRTPRTRGNLQQLITTILWQAEYGLYDNADSVRRVSMMNLHNEPQIIEFDSTEHTEEVVTENREDDDSFKRRGSTSLLMNE